MSKSKTFASITAAPLMQDFCKSKSLQQISATNFMHDITFGHGQISMLVSNADVFQFYYENKIPMLCTNDSGRTLADGIYLNKILEQQYNECSILLPLMVQVGKCYNENFGQNSLHIVVREDDCQHLYSLFFDLSETDFLHWIVNNGNFLQEFIANYNHVAKDTILEAKSIENRIILPNSNVNDISQNILEKKLPQVTLIHKNNKFPIHLSIQQSRCFELTMQGLSAKEIALEMKLSHRTIEHYLAKIREILGCRTNKELIISYFDQQHYKQKMAARSAGLFGLKRQEPTSKCDSDQQQKVMTYPKK